jgi:hypothetical protein
MNYLGDRIGGGKRLSTKVMAEAIDRIFPLPTKKEDRVLLLRN